jgi:hypothetical protein
MRRVLASWDGGLKVIGSIPGAYMISMFYLGAGYIFITEN